MKIFRIHALVLIALSTGCSGSVKTQNVAPTTKPADSQVARTDVKQDLELRNQIEQIASTSKGRVGVAAVVLETGESVSLNPRDHFPMQSVYKLPIGMAVMQQVDAGKIKLDQKGRITKDDLIGRAHHSPIRDKYCSQ